MSAVPWLLLKRTSSERRENPLCKSNAYPDGGDAHAEGMPMLVRWLLLMSTSSERRMPRCARVMHTLTEGIPMLMTMDCWVKVER